MIPEQKESTFSLAFIFGAVRRYFWYIVAIVGISAILAIVLTMPAIYPPEFKSSATIYPTSPERYDLTNIFHDEPSIYLYGASKEVEKLDNLANSEEVMIYVMDSLDLWQAYGIDKEKDESPKFEAARIWNANMRTIRIEGNGLTIEAFDVKPERAAAIVNLVIDKIDELNKAMLTSNKSFIYQLYREGYQNLETQLDLLTDSARKVRRRYNVLNVEYQTQKVTEMVLLAEADLASAQAELRNLEDRNASEDEKREARDNVKKMQARVYALTRAGGGSEINLENFRDGIDKVLSMDQLIAYLSRDLKDAREKIEYMEMMNRSDFSTILTPQRALPSDRKSRPIRWLILLGTVLISSLVSILGAAAVDRLTTPKTA